jgi:hypothetical protein
LSAVVQEAGSGITWPRPWIPKPAGERQITVASQIRKFDRLFMVAGMNHCSGGVGATNFGQSGVTPMAFNAEQSRRRLTRSPLCADSHAPFARTEFRDTHAFRF